MNNTINTFDFYEAAYYLTLGASLDEVIWFRELGRERFRITLSGEKLTDAQRVYLNGNAEVNLNLFRTSYNRLRTAMFNSKKLDKVRKGGVL